MAVRIPRNRRPSSPGEILREHYLNPRKVTVSDFARAAGISRKHMSDVVNGNARIEASLAHKIAVVLGTTPQFWLNLQNAVDVYDAQQALKGWEPEFTFPAEMVA